MWNDIVLCCCTLHNVTIEVSGAGWAWDAGVVRGSLDPSDTNSTLGEDPDEMGADNPLTRLRDTRDTAVLSLRDRLMEDLEHQDWTW